MIPLSSADHEGRNPRQAITAHTQHMPTQKDIKIVEADKTSKRSDGGKAWRRY
jgi:hypothetical protein